MIIRGETMRHDSKTNTTTANGGSGFATADWGTNESLKKLKAKSIQAKMHEESTNSSKKSSTEATDSIGQDIEWIEAKDQVEVTFPGRVMTADYCKSEGKKINCKGNVHIIAGKNTVSGDIGSFDLENDRYEISTNPSSSKQVEATLHVEKDYKKEN